MTSEDHKSSFPNASADDVARVPKYMGWLERLGAHVGLRPKPTLRDEELEHFTVVDFVDRVALVAEQHGEFIAWASYERWKGRDDADVAFMVDADQQGKGIATLLLEHLAAVGAVEHTQGDAGHSYCGRARRRLLCWLLLDVAAAPTTNPQITLAPLALIARPVARGKQNWAE